MIPLWMAAMLAASPVTPAAAKPPPSTSGRPPASWILELDASAEALSDRLVDVSGRFLGTAYLHSPLGEGEGVDPDPMIRFDAVDCLTYVEQTLALALSRNPEEVARTLEALRYAKRPSYEDRNHLMEAQWLPNNVQKGFLRDITREIAGDDAVRTSKVLTRESWMVPSSKALGLPQARQIQGEFAFDMIPLDRVMKYARHLPSGTILVVIREERLHKVTRITHLGFVVQKKKRTYLRHAARSHYRAVVDEDLETFLLRNSKYSKWPVVGVALYQVRLPGHADPSATTAELQQAP